MTDSFFAELKRRNVFKVGFGYIVLGWLVIQVADVVVPALSLPDWTITFLLAMGALGFPFAIFFAWAFELTPEGIKPEAEVDRESSHVKHTGRKIDYLIIAMLTIALSYFIYDKVNRPQTPQNVAPQKENLDINTAIAVMPFVNMSADPEQEFFSDGITEELLNVLAKSTDLLVASRTSSFQFKGKDLGIPEIAEQLKVRYVLEGSVRKAGDTIRITAQLIDAKNDRHLWSEAYDRPLNVNNIFVIQDEISTAIFTALGNELGINTIPHRSIANSTNNLTAYEIFFKARRMFQTRTQLDEVEKLLEQILDLDPNYAEAWGLRAANTSLLREYLYSDEPLKVLRTRARTYANKAVAINPDAATALAVLSKLELDTVINEHARIAWEESLARYDRVLELEPNNPQALNWVALAYSTLGNMEKASEYFDRCIRAEPRYQPCLVNQMVTLASLGDDKAAIDLFIDGMDAGAIINMYGPVYSLVRADNLMAFLLISNDRLMLKDWDGQKRLFEALKNPDGDHVELVAEIEAFVEESSNKDVFMLQTFLLPLNHQPASGDNIVHWDPIMVSFRKSDNFKNMLRKTGVYDYWKTHGFPEKCRPIGSDDFECD